VGPLEADDLLHHRLRLLHLLAGDHEGHVVRAQGGVGAEVGVDAPLGGEARDGHRVPEVPPLEYGGQHDAASLPPRQGGEERPDSIEESGDGPERVVAAVRVVERDADLVDAGFHEAGEAVGGE